MKKATRIVLSSVLVILIAAFIYWATGPHNSLTILPNQVQSYTLVGNTTKVIVDQNEIDIISAWLNNSAFERPIHPLEFADVPDPVWPLVITYKRRADFYSRTRVLYISSIYAKPFNPGPEGPSPVIVDSPTVIDLDGGHFFCSTRPSCLFLDVDAKLP